MAIAYDNQTFLTMTDPDTTASVSHTVTGSNTILWGVVHNSSNVNPAITAVTYNGVSLTSAIGYTMTNGQRIELFYLIAPASGAHTFSITRADATNHLEAYAVSYTGARQSGQPDATATNNNTVSTGLTTTLTTVADNTISVYLGYSNGSQPTAGTNSTLRGILATDRSTYFDSTGVGPTTPAGSFSMTFTNGTSIIDAGVMASFAPFIAAASSRRFDLNLLGVGQ